LIVPFDEFGRVVGKDIGQAIAGCIIQFFAWFCVGMFKNEHDFLLLPVGTHCENARCWMLGTRWEAPKRRLPKACSNAVFPTDAAMKNNLTYCSRSV